MTLCKEIYWQIWTLQELNMNNVFHKKVWNAGTNPSHVEPLLIPLIKETYNGKSDEYLFKIKLRRGTTSSTSNLYEFNMHLFDHGDLEEFLLFIWNFNMTLTATSTLDMEANI